MIDEKVMKMFEGIIKINKNMILEKKHFSPMCAIIEEGYKMSVVVMPLSDYKSKEMTREFLKKFVLSKKTIAYMIGMDARMTMMDMNDRSKAVVKDALVNSIFSPRDNLVKVMIYDEKDGKRFIESEMDDDSGQQNSVWNVWNMHDEDEIKDIEEDYAKFKKDNPDKFKEVV
jgi:hypothetical protein